MYILVLHFNNSYSPIYTEITVGIDLSICVLYGNNIEQWVAMSPVRT